MSFNPLVWKSFDLSNPKQEQLFMGQLTDLLNFLNSAQGLSTLLNGSALLGATAMNLGQFNLGVVSVAGTYTVNCSQSSSVAGYIAITTAITIGVQFNNMAPGIPVSFRFGNFSTGPATFFMGAANPSGTGYSVTAFPTGTLAVNMSSGLSVPASTYAMFSGASYGNDLDLLVNVT